MMFQANGGIERAVLDAYCWMYSSWNIPQEYKGACTGGDQVRHSIHLSKGFGFQRVNKNDRVTISLKTNFQFKSLILIFSSRSITAYV